METHRIISAVVLAATFVPQPQVHAASGRRCTIVVESAELAAVKPKGTTWDRTFPGHPDPRLRLQVGGYLFKTRMGCNTARPVWNQKFEACLNGREDATLKVVDVDRVTEDLMGATATAALNKWFDARLFRSSGTRSSLLAFGSVVRLKWKIVCRRRWCRIPRRKKERIAARVAWKFKPPRFLLYKIAIAPQKLAQYRKDAMMIQLTHWVGEGQKFSRIKGVYRLPAAGQWGAFPFPMLCLNKAKTGGRVTRKARVLIEIRGSPILYAPASGVQPVVCR